MPSPRRRDTTAVTVADAKTTEAAYKHRLRRPRPCHDGVYVGDEVYGTRKDEYSLLWHVGTVTEIQSTNLLEVDWHSMSLNPYSPHRIEHPNRYRQWHDRAGVAHIKCRLG